MNTKNNKYFKTKIIDINMRNIVNVTYKYKLLKKQLFKQVLPSMIIFLSIACVCSCAFLIFNILVLA